jgi:hypothetical protein
LARFKNAAEANADRDESAFGVCVESIFALNESFRRGFEKAREKRLPSFGVFVVSLEKIGLIGDLETDIGFAS